MQKGIYQQDLTDIDILIQFVLHQIWDWEPLEPIFLIDQLILSTHGPP